MSLPSESVTAAGRATGAFTPQQLALLEVFASAEGRCVPREVLRRRAGLRDLSPRRCDSLLVGLRRVLGEDAIVNVRGRGWRCVVPLDAGEFGR